MMAHPIGYLFCKLCLEALTKLICGEMLCPERLAIGEFHLVFQLKAITLEMWRICIISSSSNS